MLSVLFVCIGITRIVSTYPVLTHVIDEPLHISCGMEWLEKGKYSYEPQHPPLTRVLAAAGARWAGARNVSKEEFLEAHKILYAAPSYERVLSWARAGELPFFVLASLVVWLWGRRVYDEQSAMWAVLLFTTTPSVLAHAGLATTDIGLTAMTMAACYGWWRWLQEPDWRRTLIAATAIAGGVLSKFTFLVFFPVCGLWLVLLSRRGRGLAWPSWARWRWAGVMMALVMILVWSGYLFCVTPVSTQEGPWGIIPHLPRKLQKIITARESISLPAGPLYEGVVRVMQHNFEGHRSFLLGDIRREGWWYFFPVVLFFKTPLPGLILFVWGISRPGKSAWRSASVLGCAGLILLVSMSGSINLGIRHVLPVVALMVLPGGFALASLFGARKRRWWGWAVGAVLVGWSLSSSVGTHPNYIAYFNELAGGQPEDIRADADLDWGQSIALAAKELKSVVAREPVGLRLYGTSDWAKHGLAINGNYVASAWVPRAGWTAIGATDFVLLETAPPEVPAPFRIRKPWWWLSGLRPERRLAGGAVLLFRVSEEHIARIQDSSE